MLEPKKIRSRKIWNSSIFDEAIREEKKNLSMS